MAVKRLLNELKDIKKDPNYFYSLDLNESDIFIWNFSIIGPSDTLYEGGIFSGILKFTNEYPNKPPIVKFDNILHPNIYNEGHVCISILHEGSDQYGYEKDSERWSPTQNINSIMLSIISMLSAPNFESPANVEASVLWKNEPLKYKHIIYQMVASSQG
jgi:ubiquitin-conjugating enzyme E2 G1